jgi:hypothetical protein
LAQFGDVRLHQRGLIFDGSGSDPLEGDVVFDEGRIMTIGNLAGSTAERNSGRLESQWTILGASTPMLQGQKFELSMRGGRRPATMVLPPISGCGRGEP